MRYLVTGRQMKEIDRNTIEKIGIPSVVLMERAALLVADQAGKLAHREESIWVACGCGNNGADGVAAARMLFLKGYKVAVIIAGNLERATRELTMQLDIADRLGIPVFPYEDFIPGCCDVLIDALFGVGLDRPVEGEYKACISMLRQQSPRVTIAVDIPSGIHSDTGAVMGVAIKADITVTFGYEKAGTVLYPGKAYAGHVLVGDIGFPEICLKETAPNLYTYGPEDLRRIPERAAYSNKGSFGKVLVAAGSTNMAGAAYLSALAAYRTGAGLVKIFTVEENRVILQQLLPEAILVTYDSHMALEDEDAWRELVSNQCEWASVIIVGPGLGQEEYARSLVELVLENAYVPIVIDADALNAIARYPGLKNYYTENIIVTPHVGEMTRLTGKSIGEIQENLTASAREYSDSYGVTCVVKDAATVVALKDGSIYLNSSGNSAMAKAGSGDVLTGIIGGLLALGMEEGEAATLGVYLHGVAGDKVRGENGSHGLLARDLAEYIPDRESCGRQIDDKL